MTSPLLHYIKQRAESKQADVIPRLTSLEIEIMQSQFKVGEPPLMVYNTDEADFFKVSMDSVEKSSGSGSNASFPSFSETILPNSTMVLDQQNSSQWKGYGKWFVFLVASNQKTAYLTVEATGFDTDLRYTVSGVGGSLLDFELSFEYQSGNYDLKAFNGTAQDITASGQRISG